VKKGERKKQFCAVLDRPTTRLGRRPFAAGQADRILANRDGTNERNQLRANLHPWRHQMNNWAFDYESDSQAKGKQRLQKEIQEIHVPAQVHNFMNWLIDRLPPAIKVHVQSKGNIGQSKGNIGASIKFNFTVNWSGTNSKWAYHYRESSLAMAKIALKFEDGLPQEVYDFMSWLIDQLPPSPPSPLPIDPDDTSPPPIEPNDTPLVDVRSAVNIEEQVQFNFTAKWAY
jgi:hypothetical protein